ncbi:metallophosphoesterase [Pseudomonas sp. PDM31]|uniref:metallophosphoesterase family protein n=1 Tax=Pseudomonas sp. PDM31 TaxID=2854778 RepID=UPI001C4758A3|nr:phosphoesterase [Pseudomonas sp. PDM31]MBV7478399.1 phosphoesterase [Pseudomonas sp. PDM31]
MWSNKKTSLLLGALIWIVPFLSHSAQKNDSPLHMVFSSNPQYPRTEATESGRVESDSEREKRSKFLIEAQYSDIADFRRNSGGPDQVPVMINGDLTMYGRGWQRSVVMPILQEKLESVYDYGLGKRDYEKNLANCFLNSCAATSIEHFKGRYWGKVDSMDFGVRVSGRTDVYYGSLAYSRTIGDVHLVQLNNEPTYSVTFFSGTPLISPLEVRITDALDWLERDLRKARQQGRIIILNMHKVRGWMGSEQQIERFRTMIQAYKVTAVFAGHYHWHSGRYWNASDRFGNVPVFLSGSAIRQTYLIASISADRQALTVNRVEGNYWPGRQLEAVVEVQY